MTDTTLLPILRASEEWILKAPHGDNCFVSDHYEGDPGNRCNCGKESIERAIAEALESADTFPSVHRQASAEGVNGGDPAWQMEMAHQQLDRMGIPRSDSECYLSAWGRFVLAFEEVAGLRINIPLTGPATYAPVRQASAGQEGVEEDVELSRACVRSWDQSKYTSGESDAVHPMYCSAFFEGYRAALATPPAAIPAAPSEARKQRFRWTDGTRTLKQDVLSAVHAYADSKPENDPSDPESWESWFEAAFDLCGDRIGDIFDEHERRAALAQPAPVQQDERLAEWEKLRDPAVLHANLLRGIPSKLTREHLLHLLGTDAPVQQEAATSRRRMSAPTREWLQRHLDKAEAEVPTAGNPFPALSPEHRLFGALCGNDPSLNKDDVRAVLTALQGMREAWAEQFGDNACDCRPEPENAGHMCAYCQAGAALQPTQGAAPMPWPKARDVGRLGDMSPTASMRVGLDSDNDVYVTIAGDNGIGEIEFCTPGSGGGQSPRVREALIALMVAMEEENATSPDRDWWARRNRKTTQGAKGGA